MAYRTTQIDRSTKRLSRRTLLGLVVTALALLGVLPAAPAHADHPSPLNATQINSLAGSRTAVEANLAAQIVVQINGERAARGLPPLTVNQFGANVAFSNSYHNRASGCVGSGCHMSQEEWNAAYGSGPPSMRAENVTAGPFYSTTGATTRAFMNSDGHRWNILRRSPDLVGVGVACTADGGMWVTHQFLVSSVARYGIDDGAAAPATNPIATSAGAGSGCWVPPSAPTGVSATAGNASATVSWGAPSHNGGSPVTGYVVTPFVGATPGTPRTFASTVTSQAIAGLTNGTAYTFTVAAINATGTGSPSIASNAVTPGTVPAAPPYAPLSPARLMDTRPGQATVDGAFAGGGSIAGGSSTSVTVTGRGGVPATGVGAVVLNVTAVGPTAPSHLTVWPTGAARPNASNVNFVAGQTVPNLVVAKVGANGQVSVYNNAGSTDLVVDVAGWFATSG
ncbi:MAG: fibronectin type III domain-containing protein [Actinobacteria bacterium]|nr:fibronectin type III domain-containing protein [Actinomycetota bacterium]